MYMNTCLEIHILCTLTMKHTLPTESGMGLSDEKIPTNARLWNFRKSLAVIIYHKANKMQELFQKPRLQEIAKMQSIAVAWLILEN